MTLFVAVLIIANFLFAARELDVILRSRDTDATRAILERIASGEERLRVVAGEPIPHGWIGKSWALTQGVQLAGGTWLLFTDADTVHDSLAAPSAQRYAIDRRYDVLSLLTDQETVSWSERLFLPTILFVILLGVGALDDVNDPRKRDTAIFNGQYVLASRKAYDAIGGHAAVRAVCRPLAGLRQEFCSRMAAVVCAGEFAMRTMRFRPGSGLAVPLGLALTLAIFATSLVAWHGGSGVVWRGRRYSAGVFDQTP